MKLEAGDGGQPTNQGNYIILESRENRDGTANRILGLFVISVCVCVCVCVLHSSCGILLVNQLFV